MQHPAAAAGQRLNFVVVLYALGAVSVVCATAVVGILFSSSVGLVRSMALSPADLTHGEVEAWTAQDVQLWLNVTGMCPLAPYMAGVTGSELLATSTADLVAMVRRRSSAAAAGAAPTTGPTGSDAAVADAMAMDVSRDGDAAPLGPASLAALTAGTHDEDVVADEEAATASPPPPQPPAQQSVPPRMPPTTALPVIPNGVPAALPVDCQRHLLPPDVAGVGEVELATVALNVWHRTLLDGVLPAQPIRASQDYWTAFRDHPVAFVFLGFAAFEFPRLLLFVYLLGSVLPATLLPRDPMVLYLAQLPVIGTPLPLLLSTALYLANPHLAIFLIGRALFPVTPDSWLTAAILRSFSWCMFLRGVLNLWLWRGLWDAPPLSEGRNVPASMTWTHSLSTRELKALSWLAFAFLKFMFFMTLTLGVFIGNTYLRPLLLTLHVSCTHWFVVFAHLIFALCCLPFITNLRTETYTPSPFFFFHVLSDHVVHRYWDSLVLLGDGFNITRRLCRKLLLWAAATTSSSTPTSAAGDGDNEPPPRWMSESGVVIREGRPGYPKYLFESLPDSILGELTCPICCEVVRHAVAVTPCGHLFCHACLRQVLAHQALCPVCRQGFGVRSVVCSMAVRRMLLGFQVPCPVLEGDAPDPTFAAFSPSRRSAASTPRSAAATQSDAVATTPGAAPPTTPPRTPSRRPCLWKGPLQALETHSHVFELTDDGDGDGDGAAGAGFGWGAQATKPQPSPPPSPPPSPHPAPASPTGGRLSPPAAEPAAGHT